MKKFLSLLFAVLFVQSLYADAGLIDDIEYYFDVSTLTAEVTYCRDYNGEIIIPYFVEFGGKRYTVTSIGNEAFHYCHALTSITIPNSVTSIGNSAFSNCTGLTSLTIPNSVTYIGENAFSGCSGLKKIEIPNSVIEIGDVAFSNCESLTSIEIPNSVTSIGNYAFHECGKLTEVKCGTALTSIGVEAFGYCEDLKSITFNSVNELNLNDQVFRDCFALENIYCNTLVPPIASTPDFETMVYLLATLYVPNKDISLYMDMTPWRLFQNIVGLEEFPEVDGVEEIQCDAQESFTIINLNGICVKANGTHQDIENLPPGIYLINGQKKIVK